MKSNAITDYLDSLAVAELELEIELAESTGNGYVVSKENARHQKQAEFYQQNLEYAVALLALAAKDLKAYEDHLARTKAIIGPRQGSAPRIEESINVAR